MNAIKLLKSSFKQEKGFGLLNIVGLSIGMAMSLLIIWYLQYHFAFDSHIPEKEKIYHIIGQDRNDGSLSFGNPLPMANAIREDYPGLGEIAALSSSSYPVTCGENKFTIKAAAADANIFDVLGTKLLVGPNAVLSEPGSSVLTRSCAQKLFKNENPVGKVFTLESYAGKTIFTVKGIIENPPANSEFDSEMYLSWESMNPSDWQKNWWWTGTHILAKVLNEAQKTDLEQKVNTILDRHKAPFIKGRYDFKLIPFKASHFRTDIENPLVPPVSSQLLWILAVVALFIITIACINFINLAIGQSQKNTKNTGIYKVLGSSQRSLATHFLVITFQKTIIAAGIASALASLLAKPFRELTLIKAESPFSEPMMWLVLLAMAIVSGLLSGLYPALTISNLKPVELLTNRKVRGSEANIFRKFLLATQFSLATVLIIAVLFIFKQITFLKNHDLGFNKEGLIVLDVTSLDNDIGALGRKVAILEQEVSKEAPQNGIVSMGAMEAIPGTGFRNNFAIFNPDNFDSYSAISIGIDENFSKVLELPVTEGRIFSEELASDKEAIMINETLKRKLGWSSIEDKQLAVFSKDNRVNVIGVFKDVNINSLAQNIPPMIYWYKDYAYPQYVAFRVKSGQEAQAMGLMKREWRKISKDMPFDTFTITSRFDSMYGNEERLSKIIAAFCLIAMILSCFGLLAYVALTVSQRTKEIGIRKVNGARTTEVMAMLNQDFIKWVTIAFVIACPIAWYAMYEWLENFAYKTELNWWVFAAAGGIAMFIALVTVSWQSWRAARRNPVESLRYE